MTKKGSEGWWWGFFHCLTYGRTPWLSERLEQANQNKKINHKCKDIHEEFFKIFIKTHTTCRSWNPGVLLEECEGQKEEYAACLLNPDPTSGQNMSVSVKCPSYLRPENLFSKVQNYKGETHNQFQTLFPVITITLHCFASKMVKVYSTQFQTSKDEKKKKNTPFGAERN